jgi:cell division septation protein DedD
MPERLSEGNTPMPHSTSADGTRKSRWIMGAAVVAAVSAVSLALGLGVVGPMIQHRMETPPVALSTSGTTSAIPSHFATPPANVEIKERVVHRPVPKPAAPDGTDSLDASSQTLTLDATPADPGDKAASVTPPKPTIHASVSDAGLDTNPDGSPADPSAAAAGRTKHPDNHSDSSDTGAPDGTGGADKGQEAGARSRGARGPKAHERRVSPLEALPPLDGSGTSGDDQNPRTVVPPEPDPAKNGRSYRVQVGHFDDEAAAQRLRDELARTGLSPQVVKTERGGATVYRVQVGTFKQKENADHAMEKLKSQSYDPYLAEDKP